MKTWSDAWEIGKVRSEFRFYQCLSREWTQHDPDLQGLLPCWPMTFGVLHVLRSCCWGKLYKDLQNLKQRFEKYPIFLACHCYLKQCFNRQEFHGKAWAGHRANWNPKILKPKTNSTNIEPKCNVWLSFSYIVFLGGGRYIC